MFLVSEISKLINGKIIGDSDFLIEGICSIKNGKINHMTYLKNYLYVFDMQSNQQFFQF